MDDSSPEVDVRFQHGNDGQLCLQGAQEEESGVCWSKPIMCMGERSNFLENVCFRGRLRLSCEARPTCQFMSATTFNKLDWSLVKKKIYIHDASVLGGYLGG